MTSPATSPAKFGSALGAGSSAFDLDRATLLELFIRHRDHPAVRMKRRLWAKLLTTALGTQFDDNDDLFVEHTYLVNTAEVIAHAPVGFDLKAISPASLLNGSKFEESGIVGVVEADFFDWVVYVPGGEPFVARCWPAASAASAGRKLAAMSSRCSTSQLLPCRPGNVSASITRQTG